MRPVLFNEETLRRRWGRSPWLPLWIVTSEWAVLRQHLPWVHWGGVVLHRWCPAYFFNGAFAVETFVDLDSGCLMRRKEKKHEQFERRAAADSELVERCPTLFDYLTATCYEQDPNQPRTTSTLTLFAQDGVWKANLRDRSEGCCLWVASPTLLGLLDILEAELNGATAVWRLDRLAGAAEASRRPIRKSSGQREPG